VSTETQLLAYPSLAPIVTFDDYTNQDEIAVDPHGRWFAVTGHVGIHVYDLPTRRRVTTFAADTPPGHLCASADGERLITAGSSGRLGVYDLTGTQLHDLDAAPGRTRKPSVNTVAADPRGRYLASGRDDGTVDLWDARTLAHVRAHDKHDTTVPDTGARSLSQVGFDPDGARLWVSAGLKGKPPGLSAYDLP